MSDHQVTWICQDLGAGTHELNIQNDQGYDMFVCLNSGASTLSLPSTTSSSGASTVPVGYSATATRSSSHPSTTHTSLTATSSTVLSPSASPPSTAQSAPNTRRIVAGTVGGALFLMAVAACWYLLNLLRLRRRRRDRQGNVSLLRTLPFS